MFKQTFYTVQNFSRNDSLSEEAAINSSRNLVNGENSTNVSRRKEPRSPLPAAHQPRAKMQVARISGLTQDNQLHLFATPLEKFLPVISIKSLADSLLLLTSDARFRNLPFCGLLIAHSISKVHLKSLKEYRGEVAIAASTRKLHRFQHNFLTFTKENNHFMHLYFFLLKVPKSIL